MSSSFKCCSCKHSQNGDMQVGTYICELCFSYDHFEPKDATNYDRLTHMSMEELAEFEHSIAPNSCPPGIDHQACIDDLYAHGEGPYPEDEQCCKCWLDWLKQEAADA